jgi:hypothetical protein
VGFENARASVRVGEDREISRESVVTGAGEPSEAGSGGSTVARLAIVALNAVRNGDLARREAENQVV